MYTYRSNTVHTFITDKTKTYKQNYSHSPVGVDRRGGGDLDRGVEHDHVVALGPLVEARVQRVGVADLVHGHLAAVEGDVQLALRL